MVNARCTLLASLVATFLVAAACPAAEPDAGNNRVKNAKTAYSEPATGMEFVKVPGGCFTMGDTQGDGQGDEKPLHQVCLDSFLMGRYEVTNGQYRKFRPDHHSGSYEGNALDGDNQPVTGITWYEAAEYAGWLTKLSGSLARLPSEAEWEFACREQGKNLLYCGNNSVDSVAWQQGNSGSGPRPVGLKQPKSLGFFDLSGNVWEWVLDWNASYPAKRKSDPQGAVSGSSRVRRGGSWQYDSSKARATWRSSGYQDDRAMDIGFRLAHP